MSDVDEGITEDEDIELAYKYLPEDIKVYYKEPEYKLFVSEREITTYKRMEFNLNQVGRSEFDNDNLEYGIRFFITFEEENGEIKMIRIHETLPNWMIKIDNNSYDVKDWYIQGTKNDRY